MKKGLLSLLLLISIAGFSQSTTTIPALPQKNNAALNDTIPVQNGHTYRYTVQQLYDLIAGNFLTTADLTSYEQSSHATATYLRKVDTSFLHDQIAQLAAAKLNSSDTSLLHNQIVQVVNAIGTKFNISDTSILHAQIAQAVAAIAANTTAISNNTTAIAGKLNISDTSFLHNQIAQTVNAIGANTTAIGNKVDKTTTISVNGANPQALTGANVNLTIAGGGGGSVSASDTSTLNVHTTNYNNALFAVAPSPEKGYIIQDHFTALSNWTSTGTAFTASSSKLNVPDGSNSFTASYLKNTSWGGTNLRKWTANVYKYIIPTISATSFGITVGIKSLSNSNRSLAFRFCTDATKKGLIEVYAAESIGTIIATSPNPLAITAGDSTDMRIQRIKNTLIATWRNLSAAGKPFVTFRFEAQSNSGTGATPPNYGQFAIYANGGATTIDSVSVYDNELMAADLAVVGTSIDVASTTANPNQTWVAQYENLTGQKVAVFAGNSNRIDDVNIAEVIAHNPKNVLLSLATNNLANGEDTTTMKTKLATMVSALTTAGYVYGTNLFVTNVMPRNDFDATLYNIAIANTYPNPIDINTTFRATGGTGLQTGLSADGIHLLAEPQQDYAAIIATAMLQKGKATLRNNPQTYNRAAYYQGKRIQLGTNSAYPTYPIEINTDDNNNTPFKINSSANLTDGLYMGMSGTGAGAGYFLNGAAYDNGAWTAKSTVLFGIRSNGTQMMFMGRTNTSNGAALGAFDATTSSVMGYIECLNSTANASRWHLNPVMEPVSTSTTSTSITKFYSYTRLAALSTASVSITAFPAATTAGQVIVVQNLNTSTSFTWGAPTAAKWDDGTSITTFPNNSILEFVSDGTNWVAQKITNSVGAAANAGTVTLSGGTATVSTTAITATSVIQLTYQNCSSCATVYKGTVTAGTSFVINSSNAGDASTVAWKILY